MAEPQLDELGDWRRSHFSVQIRPEMDGLEVTLFGWVQTIRDLGKIKFIVLSDREGSIQITIHTDKVNPETVRKAEQLRKQSIIGVKGRVKASEKAQGGVEIIPGEIKVLSLAEHPLDLDPTGRIPADLDVRLNARILDLRRPESLAIFKINHHVLHAIREFLEKEGFLEVQTPKIIATATEGGAALFPVVYFDREAFLAQSPQLYKEQLTSVFDRVFEIATFFRAEESRTTRHVAEFVSVDIEAAFSTMDDVMEILERMIYNVLCYVKNRCIRELNVLGREIKVQHPPFKRYTYDEVLGLLAEKDFKIPWGEDIPTQGLRILGEILPETYYFITDWPTKSKPFYIKPRSGNPEICEAFDLMYGFIEIASGGTRIHDKSLLISRMREQGLNPESFHTHLRTFDYGMPPHAGWGLGLNRLLMALTGRENIRECILFPRDRDRLTP